MISALPLSEADTRAKLIHPAIHACGWSEDLICRETTLGAVEIVAGKARRRTGGRTDYTLRVLKAVNPNRKADVDRRTPAELLDLIEAKGREVAESLAALRALIKPH